MTFTAIDDSGNSVDATASVTVVDTTPPKLIVPEDTVVKANVACKSDEGDQVGVSINDEEVQAFLEAFLEAFLDKFKAYDIVDGEREVFLHDRPDCFVIDTATLMTFSATDKTGNQATATYCTVWETQIPTDFRARVHLCDAGSKWGTGASRPTDP